MSATIKYKGETIATASNNTKTLLTAGKYMEANVVVTDDGGGGGATLQTKSVSYTPSETAISDAVLPDTGYDGLDRVNVSVGAIDPNYVGSEVPRKSSSDLMASGATVTAPSGYYSANATKTIPNASQALTDAYVQSSGDLEVELNTSSEGYVANGNQYLQFEDFTTPVPTTTYYATSSDQVIMSQNSMAFGAQTIKGVTTTNLLASNIKKDVVVEVGDSADPDRIVSVTGTYEGGGGGGGSWTEQTIATSGSVSQALNENTIYHFTGDLTALNVSFNASSATHPNYRFDFLSGTTPPTLTVPSIVVMPYSFSVKARHSYVMDVFDNVCSFNDQLNVDPYHYSTTDGSLYYGKGAPPSGGGANWKIIGSSGVRSFLAVDYGDCEPFSWDSSTSSFPDYGKTLYPIPIPSDATGIRITIPNRRCGPSFWTWAGSTNYTRVLDPGWQNNVDGVVSYNFTAGIYEYLCVNIDSGTLESSADLRFVTS